ncbi:hypothetical protein EYC80_005190 [Monilinia laxa]|uniref:Uncharacterized protein n=1 Tax=Monilinia laxa TaxID=61186 RepID=A0A5N6KJ49_MONLA|nr:hypothetical protein EYC80_005190 [Monilinia laxa]
MLRIFKKKKKKLRKEKKKKTPSNATLLYNYPIHPILSHPIPPCITTNPIPTKLSVTFAKRRKCIHFVHPEFHFFNLSFGHRITCLIGAV